MLKIENNKYSTEKGQNLSFFSHNSLRGTSIGDSLQFSLINANKNSLEIFCHKSSTEGGIFGRDADYVGLKKATLNFECSGETFSYPTRNARETAPSRSDELTFRHEFCYFGPIPETELKTICDSDSLVIHLNAEIIAKFIMSKTGQY